MKNAICQDCRTKIIREIVQHRGGCVPMNELPCEYSNGEECEWEPFAKEIIETFNTKYKLSGQTMTV